MKNIRRWPIVVCFVLVFRASGMLRAEPMVVGFQRFHNEPSIQPLLGHLLVGELNCLRCHQASPALATNVRSKAAPNLSEVSGRIRPEYLRRFIADPLGTKPGTTMPNLFHGRARNETQGEVEAIVHYLTSLGKEPLRNDVARTGSRRRGKALYHQVGCLGCHDEPNTETPLSTSVPHGELTAKYTLNSLARFLKDPLHVRPSGRMPDLNLTQSEADDIAAYLLPNIPEKAGAAYAVYRGSWQRLPDFDKLTPVEYGGGESINAKVVKDRERYGLRWEARFAVEENAEYTLHLGSDDGSRLRIDGETVIDNDGVHGNQFKTAKVTLNAGEHDLLVDYFEASGQEELAVLIEGPDLPKMPIDRLLVVAESEVEQAERIDVDPDLVARGRSLFHSVGCANCHDVPVTAPSETLTATDVGAWNTDRGCLSETPVAGVPFYELTETQRSLLKHVPTTANLATDDSIPLSLLTFNCYACHPRDGIGGVEASRNQAFQTTQKEMGDEGRIPPNLDLIGAKLTAAWFDSLLSNGAKDRPYMLTRMPKFGRDNVIHLRRQFEKVDSLPPLPEFELDVVEAKRAAWRMIGNRGFGCIQCHSFGLYKATGIQSIDMTIMTKRLKETWFRHYVRDPQMFRKGTRMPSAWPKDESILRDELDGSSAKQIAAIWIYLKDGRRAKTPLGLETNSMELIPMDEAIVYRNFIAGAGPRAIGVGNPEGAHLAFDANNLSVALIWKGAFIDAKRHWTGRGQGFEPPKGEDVQSFGEVVSFAFLQKDDQAWPTTNGRELGGYRFRAYRLDKLRRPTFFYSVRSAEISDKTIAVETATSVSLQRKMTIESPDPHRLFFRAAAADSIVAMDDDWYRVGGKLKIRLQSSQTTKPIIRESAGQFELLLPITENKVNVTQEYAW